MTLGSPLLSAIPGLRHAFFSREGGVSEGIYAGLNGGLGSNDDPANVAENRRRMAQQMGEVAESSRALETEGFPAVADGPILALFAEQPPARGADARPRVTGTSRARSSAPSLKCHLNSLGRTGPISVKCVSANRTSCGDPGDATPSTPGGAAFLNVCRAGNARR